MLSYPEKIGVALASSFVLLCGAAAIIVAGSNDGAELARWLNARGVGVPVEAHSYQLGPHGTSMSPGDPLLGEGPGLVANWMKVSEFLGKES